MCSDGETLATYGLGSCVVVILHHAESQTGGLAHMMLPKPPDYTGTTGTEYVNHGTKALSDEFLSKTGCSPDEVRVVIVGGSEMLQLTGQQNDIGLRNAEVARKTLDSLGYKISAEDIGGGSGRSVLFHVGTGDVTVKSAVKDEVLEL